MLGRPRNRKRKLTNRAYYYDHPMDIEKPIPVSVICNNSKCKKMMFHFEIAHDATVVVFKTKCKYCNAIWSVRIRRNGLKAEFKPDERDSFGDA